MSATNKRNDPALNYNFKVRFDSLPTLGFCHVEGLASSVRLKKPKNDRNGNKQLVPGKTRFSNIILRRGFDQTKTLWNWYEKTIHGNVDKRNGEIVLLNDTQEPIMRFQLRAAWPCRWQLYPLDALHPAFLIEEIELVIDSFNIAS